MVRLLLGFRVMIEGLLGLFFLSREEINLFRYISSQQGTPKYEIQTLTTIALISIIGFFLVSDAGKIYGRRLRPEAARSQRFVGSEPDSVDFSRQERSAEG